MRLLAVAAFVLSLQAPRIGLAEEHATTSATVVLLLARDTPPAQKEAALAAIRSQMADVPVHVVVEEAAVPRGDLRAVLDLATELSRRDAAIGTFWLDLDRDADLLLYLVEAQGSRLLVRRIRSSKGAEGAALEEVALITRYATSALVEGSQIGMQPVAPPAPRTPAAPAVAEPASDTDSVAARARTWSGMRLGAGYAGAAWPSDLGWQNGVRLFATYGPGRSWYVGASYAWEAPLVVDATGTSARIVRRPAEAFVGGRYPVGIVEIAAELGIGVDAETRSTTRSANGLTRTPDDTVATVSVAPRLGVVRQAWGRAEFFGFAGLDYIVNPTAYVLETPAPQPVVGSTRWRPRLDLGVSVALW